jgi:hypothetical protein
MAEWLMWTQTYQQACGSNPDGVWIFSCSKTEPAFTSEDYYDDLTHR